VDNQKEVALGREGVIIESAFIPLFAAAVFGMGLENNYNLVFILSFVVLITFLIIRIAADQADDPNLSLIRWTIAWGSRLFHITLVGSVASLSIYIYTRFGFFSPEQLFGILGIGLALTIGIIDQLVLGEYVKTWNSIIREQTGDSIVGKKMGEVADIAQEGAEKAQDEESNLKFWDYFKALLIGVPLLILLILATLPISVFFSYFLGSFGVSILVLLSLIVLRDIPRYIYIRYGASPTFSDLKKSTKFEFGWIGFLGILLAGSLGHDLLSYIL